MRELPTEKLILYGAAVAVVAVVTPFLHKIPRRMGRNPLFHLLYFAIVAVTLIFVPEWIQDEIFSPGGVLVVGTIVPIYESIVAVCTIEATDDRAWLQFWIASASFSFATEFMDEITAHLPQAGEHWYEFEFFFTAWLMLPITDGAGLMYDCITKPYISPTAESLKNKLEGWMQVVLTAVNTWYIWLIWFTFMSLPEEQRRFLVVGLGTVYPILASTAAITTSKKQEDVQEESFWLTYWSTFSILFIFMDYVENFIGHIKGFYSICAVATLYLFLPMFRGSEVVFRRVLVPLSGQYENMLLHDAYLVKLGMEASIPAAHHERVMSRAASLFQKSKKTQKAE